ncbi:tRNA ligase 1 [Camellia lanceoleosa]|uniref:tRNA ligase 1 n=1 Tax=Camellia lanceoleosa TaxID=1840588 RepID=A0ACC0I1R6_9ERIC|nr:tRNA ligase 1 [Camellia lanceoleosa]
MPLTSTKSRLCCLPPLPHTLTRSTPHASPPPDLCLLLPLPLSPHPFGTQVPFEFAVEKVLEQLRTIAKGDYSTPSTEKRKFGNIVYATISLPVGEIRSLLDNVTLHWGP